MDLLFDMKTDEYQYNFKMKLIIRSRFFFKMVSRASHSAKKFFFGEGGVFVRSQKIYDRVLYPT